MCSLVAQMVKCLPTMRETQVRSLCWEDPLEKEMVTHSGILAWKIPWTDECGRLQSMGLQRVRHDWATSLCYIILCTVPRCISLIYSFIFCCLISSACLWWKLLFQWLPGLISKCILFSVLSSALPFSNYTNSHKC